MKTYEEFLTRIIDDGIAAARADYKEKPDHLEGAIAGFEACRGKTSDEIARLLESSRRVTAEIGRHNASGSPYWHSRCYELEIEWVANVISAALWNEGKEPLAPHLPTARGVMKAAEILGVGGAL